MVCQRLQGRMLCLLSWKPTMKKNLLLITVLFLFPFASKADSPTFDYFEGGYANWDDSIGGIEVRMNYRIFTDFYISGYHAAFLEKDFDNDITTLGLGYIFDLPSNSSFFAEANYAIFHVDGGFDHEGFELASGFRRMLSKQFEAKVAIEHFELFDDNTPGDSLELTSLVLGAAYIATDSITVYADYKFEKEVNRFSLGARFDF